MTRRTAQMLAATSVVLAAIGLALTLTAPHVPASEAGPPHPAVIVAVLAFTASGTVIASHRPGHRVGWLFLAEGLAWLLYFAADAHRAHAVVAGGSLAADVVAEAAEWLNLPAITLFPFTFLLFPTGRLPSPPWKLVAALVVAGMAVRFVGEVLVPDASPLRGRLVGVGNLVFAPAAFACVVSPIVRRRRANDVERHQLKWFAMAGVGVAIGWTAANVVEATGLSIDAALLRIPSLALLPIAAAVAIVQYRLYDIDIVISRALVFGALAALVGVVYVAVVVVVGERIGASEPSPALSVLATAITALAFAPVRDRAERAAARIVYGVRAQPYDVLASFTSRMAGAVPPDEILPVLARTAASAVGAASVTVWVRAGQRLQPAVTWPADRSVSPVELASNGELPELDGDAAFPIRHDGRLLGAITVTASAGDRVASPAASLLEGLASAAGLALENVQLIQELRASRQRLVEAQDAERRRIERNLHDGAQQRLLELGLTLQLASGAAARGDGDEARSFVEEAASQLRASLAELRELARGIHPAILTEQGLGAAVDSLVDRVPLPVRVQVDVATRLPDAVEATLYFTISEALSNVVKHARATCAAVRVVATDAWLVCEVADDGVGGADPNGGGLRGLSDRVAALDGTLEVAASDGVGTRLRARLPAPAAARPVA